MLFSATVYRAHHPRWSFDPLSGTGAARHGGRFNPRGMAALYTSLRFETAWREAQQGFAFKAQPLTLCAYRAECDDVLDLTDPATREAHGIRPGELACAWEDLADRGIEPPSWRLARRLREAGIAAILVPSYAPGATPEDVNAVFWDWGEAAPHSLRLVDDERRLPRDDASWR